MGTGAGDKPKTPKPPTDNPPVPPDAQKSQLTRPADKTTQPDGKDNHSPAGPQGGKPADGAPKSGDTGPRQPGDRSGDPGPRHSGDGPVKISDGARIADAPHHAGDQQPGPRMSSSFADWKASFRAQWQPHPEAAMKPVSPEVKIDRRPEKFSVNLDLSDGCRDQHGKLVMEKVKAKIAELYNSARSERTSAHLKNDSGPAPTTDAKGYPHGGHREVHLGKADVTVHVQHARSYDEVRQVRTALDQVRGEYKVTGHVEVGGRPVADRPGPTPHHDQKPRPETKPVPRPSHGGLDHLQVHREHQEVRPVPPPRPITPVQPHIPWR